MGMADKFYQLAQDAQMVAFSDIGYLKKQECFEKLKEKADKLSKKFSREEKFFTKLNIGENHLANVFACQDVCYIMLDQLKERIKKEEEEGLI